MPNVEYRQADGTAIVVDVPEGTSLMKAALASGVRGIVAECGGSLMCATCHVYFDDAADARRLPMSDEEDELLDCTAEPRTPASRLSCQIPVDAQLDGVTVVVPGRQT